jgi:hypothetical protein
VVDRGRVHSRALDGFARSRREAVGQWRAQTADNECFYGEGASEPVTRAKGYDETVEDCAHFMIRPDPGCPECTTIMDWRSTHRGIVITDAAEIKLADYGWGDRHLHVRDLRVARRKNRVVRERKERERKERLHPVA